MTWLIFLFALEGGYGFNDAGNNVNNMILENPIYLQFEPEIILFEHLHIAGTARVNMFKMTDAENFMPVQLVSDIRVYFQFTAGKTIIRFGYHANCNHPVTPWDIETLPGQEFNSSVRTLFLRVGTK